MLTTIKKICLRLKTQVIRSGPKISREPSRTEISTSNL